MPKRLLLCVAVVLCTAVAPLSAHAHPADGARTNATYFNNAALPAADPYVLHDKRSGYYYAYSTDGADPGYYFGVYRSADLATWQKVPGGATYNANTTLSTGTFPIQSVWSNYYRYYYGSGCRFYS